MAFTNVLPLCVGALVFGGEAGFAVFDVAADVEVLLAVCFFSSALLVSLLAFFVTVSVLY